jgi:hypothetical protein
MPHERFVESIEGGVEGSEDSKPFLRDRYIHDPSVLLATLSANQSGLLQAIDETGDPWNDSDGAIGDFEDRQTLARAAEDAKHVVLRRREPVLSKEPREPNLDLVIRPQEVESRFLLGQIKRLLFLEFVLESSSCHAICHPSFIDSLRGFE